MPPFSVVHSVHIGNVCNQLLVFAISAYIQTGYLHTCVLEIPLKEDQSLNIQLDKGSLCVDRGLRCTNVSNWVSDHYLFINNWTASSEFGTYRLCKQRRFRRACASAQSCQNLHCSLIQAVNQVEPSDRKPDPWPL